MREASGIDVVTRLYDLADLPHLDQLAFSVLGQADAAPLRMHLMLQHFSYVEVQAVREAMSGLRRLHDRASVALHNWDHPVPFDLRVPLLNWGLDVAQGRYVTCLDVHDRLCPSAFTALLARLHRTEAALALGGAALQPALWWGDVVMPVMGQPVMDQSGEATPTPVFVADRSRLAVKDCVFRTGAPDTEIREFIERLGTRYAVDATLQNDTLALRMSPL